MEKEKEALNTLSQRSASVITFSYLHENRYCKHAFVNLGHSLHCIGLDLRFASRCEKEHVEERGNEFLLFKH